MEHNVQSDLKDFITSTLKIYVDMIGTEEDTKENYFSIFSSIQEYKYKVERQDFKKFFTEIQILFNTQNQNYYRKITGEFLLEIFKINNSMELIIDKWNDYHLQITNNLNEIPLQLEKIEDSFIFYLYFDEKIEEFFDPQKIVSNRELLVGDIINFSDHELLKNIEYVHKTPLFKIVWREYSIKYGEMNLHLIPYIK